jgi:septal ring factor EnvC (AmiA/AmiB activator)
VRAPLEVHSDVAPSRHRRAGIRLLVVAGVSFAVLGTDAGSAHQPDPEATERQLEEVRARKGEVELEIDALEAADAEVQAALAALEANVATQRAELDEAERALAAAEAEVEAAEAEIAEQEERIAELNGAIDALVVDAFVNPPAASTLDSFRADSLSDATVKQALLDIQADADADLLDQLEQAYEDLEVDKAEKEELVAEAEERRAEAESELTELENALAQQEAFAADVEARLDAKLAEAESLRVFDEALAERLAQEQAEVAAALRAAQEAAAQREAEEQAAAERAAAAQAATAQPSGGGSSGSSAAGSPSGGGSSTGGSSGGSTSSSGGSSGSSGGSSTPPRSVVQPAPGGLATVTCPYGGSITVAGSIAGNVQALLNHAAAEGVSLCASSGWRDPQKQIALRRQNCGTSYFAIYEMSPSLCNPPTARPGTSMHERGLAIDFSCNGGGAIRRGNSCWNFLAAHANSYGLYNLPSEPWHWSTTGR